MERTRRRKIKTRCADDKDCDMAAGFRCHPTKKSCYMSRVYDPKSQVPVRSVYIDRSSAKEPYETRCKSDSECVGERKCVNRRCASASSFMAALRTFSEAADTWYRESSGTREDGNPPFWSKNPEDWRSGYAKAVSEMVAEQMERAKRMLQLGAVPSSVMLKTVYRLKNDYEPPLSAENPWRLWYDKHLAPLMDAFTQVALAKSEQQWGLSRSLMQKMAKEVAAEQWKTQGSDRRTPRERIAIKRISEERDANSARNLTRVTQSYVDHMKDRADEGFWRELIENARLFKDSDLERLRSMLDTLPMNERPFTIVNRLHKVTSFIDTFAQHIGVISAQITFVEGFKRRKIAKSLIYDKIRKIMSDPNVHQPLRRSVSRGFRK